MQEHADKLAKRKKGLLVSTTLFLGLVFVHLFRKKSRTWFNNLTALTIMATKISSHSDGAEVFGPSLLDSCPSRMSCVDQGFLEGSWIHRNRTFYYSNISDDSHRPKYEKRLNEYSLEHPEQDMDFLPWNQYDWKTTNPCCAFESFDRQGMCKTFQRLGIKKMLMVGDSLSRQMFVSFVELMQATRMYPERGQSPFAACMGEDNQSFTITFIPSKRLQPSLDTIETMFVDRPKDDVVHKEMSWTKELPDMDLVVLNSGAWWADATLYEQRMKDVIGYLDANYSGRAVFRTSPRGHPNCRDYEDNGPTDDSYDFEPEDTKLERTIDSARVDWWKNFPEYNQIVKEVSHKMKHPALILDVEPMTRHRVDGHLDSKRDCLHYMLPGVVDWWNIYFYNLLRTVDER